MDDQDDPTCVIKMLDDFRAGCNAPTSRAGLSKNSQSFPFRFSTASTSSSQSSSKPLKLNFDDSEMVESFHSFRKRKFDSTNESVDSEGHKTMNETSIVASPWENRRIQAELIQARTEITALEMRLNKLHALKRETEIILENEKAGISESLERERKNVSKLERHLKTVRKREADAQEELIRLKNSFNQKVFSLEEKCQQLVQENAELHNRVNELETEAVENGGETGRQRNVLESELVTLRQEAERNQQLIEDLNTELKEKKKELRQSDIDKTKLLVAQQRVKELEFEKETYQEAAASVKRQQMKLLKMPELEKEISSLQQENRRLRDTIGNKLYTENLVETLKAKVALTDSYEKELIQLRAENQHIKLQLDEWRNLLKLFNIRDKSDAFNPVTLRRLIQKLQQQEVLLTSEKTQLQLRCEALEKSKAAISAEVQAKEEKVDQLQATVEHHLALLKRMKKQLSLITWERNDLRSIVDSCQKEYSMIAHTTLDSQGMSKLESLEKVLAGYRQRMEEYEKDPSLAHTGVPANSSNSPSSGNYEALLKEKEQLIKAEELLKAERQQLLNQIEELKTQMEYRALKGDFDTRETKILHMKMNPTSMASANLSDKLNEFKLENNRLKERIKVLEEGNLQDVTRIVEERVQTSSSKEVEELRERVRSSELQNQRLREVFKGKSQEYREAVYILFGYKVDGLANKMYRLSSLYAESSEDHLMFQEDSGNMNLLENPYSQTLGDLIELHLTHQQSLPMFLAALTMNLFEKHSMTMSSPITID